MDILTALSAPKHRIPAQKVSENDVLVLAGIGAAIKVTTVKVDNHYAVIEGIEIGTGEPKKRTWPKNYPSPILL